MEEAKRVKEDFGIADTRLIDNEVAFEVASIYGKDKRQVSQLQLTSIIQPRVEEILELLELEITRAGYKGVLPAGLVLTGGTSLLKGIVPVCEEYLKMPVRSGYPENPRLVASESYGPEYAAVLGNLLYGARLLNASGGMEQNSVINNIFTRLASWFQELFR
jgi:cell division protein FtsA